MIGIKVAIQVIMVQGITLIFKNRKLLNFKLKPNMIVNP